MVHEVAVPRKDVCARIRELSKEDTKEVNKGVYCATGLLGMKLQF